ncbi:MAG TPA: peptidylprolyl isomerase [Nocardioidaceae bacterium]|nr:peptidylprolyl isomerase [Nocardioidaceae bacterium]
MKTRALAVPAILLLSLLAGCGDAKPTDTAEVPPAAEVTPTETPTTTPAGSCEWVPDQMPAAKEVDPPPVDPVTAAALTIATNRGDIKVMLDATNAPCAAGSFSWLASQGYFDGTKCHRLVVDFVLQCGDPSFTGSGGPGYSFADELTGAETYTAGTLAMANSGPDTNGSQFFIMLEDSGLQPAFTVFGSVDAAGLEVVRGIAADGNAADGVAPAEDVTIESVS